MSTLNQCSRRTRTPDGRIRIPKIKYATMREATDAMWVALLKGVCLDVYKCPRCGLLHIGHPPSKAKRTTPA